MLPFLKTQTKSLLIALFTLFFCGCAVIGGVTEVVTDVTWEAAKLTGKAVKGVVHIAQGKQVIHLKRIGNSFFADVRINRKVHGLLMVDTGATNILLSKRLALKLGLNVRGGKRIQAKVANGQIIPGRLIYLKELRVGKVRVENIPAIVLEQESGEAYDGLLGMSFLQQFVFQIDTQKSQLILQRRH